MEITMGGELYMKKLGLIGGTGPESTLIYYRDINRMIHEKTKGKPAVYLPYGHKKGVRLL